MKNSSKYLQLVIGLLASATLSLAQTSSVEPGSLNYVEGQVSSSGQTLNQQSVGHFALQPGQSLETGNGYAEVLLTPGAFLRVGPNTEFTMPAAGLADTRITLTRGDAMIEAEQVINGTHLEVTIGSTSADLLKKGLYEFTPNYVKVFDGKVDVISQTTSRKIGKGDEIALANGDGLKKTSFDLSQGKTEPLYVWSETRSRTEAAQNQLVVENPSGYMPPVAGGWFWNPYTSYYGFWPSAYLYSPFGFGFYGGYYPGFAVGYYGGYRHGFIGRRPIGIGHPHVGFHGNGVGFHGGGFHGGGHVGGGRR